MYSILFSIVIEDDDETLVHPFVRFPLNIPIHVSKVAHVNTEYSLTTWEAQTYELHTRSQVLRNAASSIRCAHRCVHPTRCRMRQSLGSTSGIWDRSRAVRKQIRRKNHVPQAKRKTPSERSVRGRYPRYWTLDTINETYSHKAQLLLKYFYSRIDWKNDSHLREKCSEKNNRFDVRYFSTFESTHKMAKTIPCQRINS